MGDQLLVVVVYHPLGSIPGRFRIVVPCGLYGSALSEPEEKFMMDSCMNCCPDMHVCPILNLMRILPSGFSLK